MNSLLDQTNKQVKGYLDILKSKESFISNYDVLLKHDRIIKFKITIMMDDGSLGVFDAYRSQHNNSRGPYKGGVRFHQDLNEDEVNTLALWMSIKTAVLDLPLGGGKGGIRVNPKDLSENELEKLSRAYAKGLYKFIGPFVDVPAPDVNTNPKIMAWMMDEYSSISGHNEFGSFTGKPLELGGSKVRDVATALGGFFVLKSYFKEVGEKVEGKTFLIQGAGNAGLAFGEIVVSHGGKVVGISDSKGGIINYEGLDMNKIKSLKSQKKSVVDYGNGDIFSQTDFLTQKADILVPAALENQINEQNVEKIDSKFILELANGPINSLASEKLFKKGIIVFPDILANAGGVTVSYFEMLQNKSGVYREENDIKEMLEVKMSNALIAVKKMGEKFGVDLRTGSYLIALERLIDSQKFR